MDPLLLKTLQQLAQDTLDHAVASGIPHFEDTTLGYWCQGVLDLPARMQKLAGIPADSTDPDNTGPADVNISIRVG